MVVWESGFQRGRPWARKLSFVSLSKSPAMSRMAGSRLRAERARCSRAISTSSECTVISMMGSVIVDSFGRLLLIFEVEEELIHSGVRAQCGW